jgi:GWxTD domain-containing protein
MQVQVREALAAWAAFGTLALGQAPEGVQLSMARFYRSGNALTLVDGFCRVPLAAVTRLPGRGDAAYRVSLVVHDSAGLELVSQSWSQVVGRAGLAVPGASVVDHFAFAARPGRYTVDVVVTDSASGRVSRQRGEVTAYAASPGASDLLLGTRLRQAAGPADTAVRAGELRKGDLFIEASGRPGLTPRQANLGYYLELYGERSETATVVLRVKTAAGVQVVASQPQAVPLPAGGGAARGMLDLGGLPPGSYRLEATVTTAGGGELTRSAEFGMAGFGAETVLPAAPAAGADRFAALSEAQLDSLYEPLIYVMEASEQGVYPLLTLEGKRRFLREFWAKRDPTPGTARNEEADRFYTGVAEANRRFSEGGVAGTPGWRTDRGRIFIRYGAPDEVLSRPQPGSAAPYEVWKYTKTRARKFVFYDVTRFANYVLIWTDERREPSRPNWRDLLGPEAVDDVERF